MDTGPKVAVFWLFGGFFCHLKATGEPGIQNLAPLRKKSDCM